MRFSAVYRVGGSKSLPLFTPETGGGSRAKNRSFKRAAELADEIYKRRLYLKKDGSKAEYTQIRARCGHYPDMFEALPGNLIRLKDKV